MRTRLACLSSPQRVTVACRVLRSDSWPIIAETMRTIGGPMYGGKPHWEHHFAALKRMLDRREPDYRD